MDRERRVTRVWYVAKVDLENLDINNGLTDVIGVRRWQS